MRIIQLIIVTLLCNADLFAQEVETWALTGGKADTLIAKKVKCNCENRGFKIKVLEHKERAKSGNHRYSKDQLCNYSYLYLYAATQDLKMDLLQQLLSFGNDTSKVCMKVHAY